MPDPAGMNIKKLSFFWRRYNFSNMPPYIQAPSLFIPLDLMLNDKLMTGSGLRQLNEDIYMGAARKIEEEELLKVVFKKGSKMYIQEQIKSRDQKLFMAMLMGNNYCENVRILFNTEDGEREIISRVWARTDKYIVLKGGMFIPLGSVIDIILE